MALNYRVIKCNKAFKDLAYNLKEGSSFKRDVFNILEELGNYTETSDRTGSRVVKQLMNNITEYLAVNKILSDGEIQKGCDLLTKLLNPEYGNEDIIKDQEYHQDWKKLFQNSTKPSQRLYERIKAYRIIDQLEDEIIKISCSPPVEIKVDKIGSYGLKSIFNDGILKGSIKRKRLLFNKDCIDFYIPESIFMSYQNYKRKRADITVYDKIYKELAMHIEERLIEKGADAKDIHIYELWANKDSLRLGVKLKSPIYVGIVKDLEPIINEYSDQLTAKWEVENAKKLDITLKGTIKEKGPFKKEIEIHIPYQLFGITNDKGKKAEINVYNREYRKLAISIGEKLMEERIDSKDIIIEFKG